MRTLALGALGFIAFRIVAMENKPHVSQEHLFIEDVKNWPLQDVITLRRVDPKVQSSIVFFVPRDSSQIPMIGYACCSCNTVDGLSQNHKHKEAMIALFKAVLDKLAGKGFKTVRFTAKLYELPKCLSPFINDSKQVPILEQKGAELVISTELP